MTLSDLDGRAVLAVAKVAPWLAPLPTAWLVYARTQAHLGWPAWVAAVAGLTLELLGVAILATTLELWAYNRERRKSDPPAVMWLPWSLVALYAVAAELLTVMLDVWPALALVAPAVFPVLSVAAFVLLGLRTEHEARIRGIQEAVEHQRSERAKRKEEREKEKQRLAKLRAQGICRICDLQYPPETLTDDGLCEQCQRRKEGKTHRLNSSLSQEVLERDGWVCYYCGLDLREAGFNQRHIDHFIPRSHGGEDIADNLVTACINCNLTKHNTLPSQIEQQRFAMYLIAKREGLDNKAQILALAFPKDGATPPKQKEIAAILDLSQGYVSSVINAHRAREEEADGLDKLAP